MQLSRRAASPTALVLQPDDKGPHYPGSGSLARLVAEGPRRDDLEPVRSGRAVLRNGGVRLDAAAEVIAALIEGWSYVVLRLPPAGPPKCRWAATVPVRLAVPGDVLGVWNGPAVWQPVGWRAAPRAGVNLPRPQPRAWAALLAGRSPARDRWVAAWRRVWEMSWE